MGTGTKIAIGCGIAVLLAGVVAIVGLGAGAYWLKGKAETVAGNITAKAEEISKYEKKANANPFTQPADGVIQEGRLQKFLEVRKQVYAVYEQHRPELENLEKRTKDKKEASFSDVMEAGTKLASLTADIRLAQLKGLSDVGMGEEEYRFIQMAVYQSAWASATEKETGRQASEAVSEAMKQSKEALRKGMEEAAKTGRPGASEEDVRKAEEAMDEASRTAKALDVPKANIELFRKYEADIKKYAMHGLAFVGL